MKYCAHLILSVDYELFGNGSGSIDCCVVEPARHMLTIADRFHAPMTFFVEALEFLALEQEAETKNGVKHVREQLVKAIKNGHDVQLHLHPQWHHANYLTNGNWKLDLDRWRISDLGQQEINELFYHGKSWLYDLLHPVNENYYCNTFRAGGWCIQPSTLVLERMNKNGIVIDSTVAPGCYNSTRGAWYDFRNVPDKPYWRAETDVCVSSESGIWEVPIATGKIGRWRHLQAIMSSRNKNGGIAEGCFGLYQGPDRKLQNTIRKIEKLASLGHVMLDFSTMHADILIDITKQWLERYGDSDHPVPIVAIAHTKNFTKASGEALNSYLGWADANNIQFSRYGQWFEAVNV